MHSLQSENGLSTVRYNFRVCMVLFPQAVPGMSCKRSRRRTSAYVLSLPLPMHLYAEYNRFCIVSSQKINIMSALIVQQLVIVPQKIDSREGLF